MFLDQNTFTKVIDSTPLISIDLIVENENGEVLLGHRTNRPAQGYWFVPGGRVRKNESLDAAFKRLCNEELGVDHARAQAEFLGPFEHFYDDYVFGEDVSTHYVVLGYRIKVAHKLSSLPGEQHQEYKWLKKPELLASNEVHLHTKWYFQEV